VSDPGSEVLRYDLNEEFSDETAVIACEIVRNGADWKFNAMGIGSCEDLADMCRKYGVNV
jgi:tellurium resistance protein TerD